MAKLITIVLLLLVSVTAYSQTPLGFNYQGVARNPDGSPQTSQSISLRISILEGSGGASVYSEIHDTQTNEFGLFTVVIGSNPGSESLGDVDWSTGDKWLQIELDATGGSNFQLVGSQQLFSVPYAMYAAKAGAGVSTGDGLALEDGVISNTAPDQEVKMLGSGTVTVSGTYPEFVISGTSANQDLTSVLAVGTDAGLESITNLADPTDPQDAATKGYVDQLDVSDADADPSNEIQDLQLVGNNLTVTLNGSPTVIDLTPYLDNTDAQQLSLSESGTSKTVGISNGNQVTLDVADNDNDDTNELQDLGNTVSGNNRTITITNGTNTTFSVADNDNSSTNEIQNLSSSASGNNRTIGISGGTGTTINVADNDNSSTNEIQSLSSSASGTDRTINISGGGGTTINVADNDNSQMNEIQDLSLSGNTLSLSSDGTTVDLSGYLLDQNNDASGSRLVNVADPINPQDVVTRNYLDIKDATDFAFKVPLAATATGADITFDLSGFTFDDGNLISGSQVVITQDGAYNLVVKGSSTLASPATLNLVINGVDHAVLKTTGLYNDSFLFKLSVGDVVELEAVGTSAGEMLALEFFGFKI